MDDLPSALRHRAVRRLGKWLEKSDWQGLRKGFGSLERLWVFDRYLPFEAAVGALEALFDESRDRKLLTLVERSNQQRGSVQHLSLSCCFLWGDAEGWRDHEVEFDLHLGMPAGDADDGDDEAAPVYLGITAVTIDAERHPETTAEATAPGKRLDASHLIARSTDLLAAEQWWPTTTVHRLTAEATARSERSEP